MRGDTIEEPSKQHIYPTACRGGDERIVDLKKLAKRVFEAEPQRVDSVFCGGLDHQPTHQEVQDDMARTSNLIDSGLRLRRFPFFPCSTFNSR